MSNFLYPVAHISTRRGLLRFKACGGSYHIVELSTFPCACVAYLRYDDHAIGKRTVGVKVNVDNTEVYVFP